MKEKEKDPRIGHLDQWPETTISGQPYTRPVSTLALTNGDFIVLDTFPPPNEEELILPFLKRATALNVVPVTKDNDEQS